MKIIKYLFLLLLINLILSNTDNSINTKPKSLGTGVIIIILFITISIIICIFGVYSSISFIFNIIAILLPIFIFLIIHIWPKDSSNNNEQNSGQKKDYWIVIRWIYFVINFLFMFFALVLLLKEFCLKKNFAVKIPNRLRIRRLNKNATDRSNNSEYSILN